MKENKGVIDVCKWRTIKRTYILDDVSFKCLNIVLDRKEKKLEEVSTRGECDKKRYYHRRKGHI